MKISAIYRATPKDSNCQFSCKQLLYFGFAGQYWSCKVLLKTKYSRPLDLIPSLASDHLILSTTNMFSQCWFNPLTAGAAYIRVLMFYLHIKYHLWNMLKIKCDINQPYLKTVHLHFVKSEWFSLTWSCGSRQRDTTSSGWKFRLKNLAVQRLRFTQRRRQWRNIKSALVERLVFVGSVLVDFWPNAALRRPSFSQHPKLMERPGQQDNPASGRIWAMLQDMQTRDPGSANLMSVQRQTNVGQMRWTTESDVLDQTHARLRPFSLGGPPVDTLINCRRQTTISKCQIEVGRFSRFRTKTMTLWNDDSVSGQRHIHWPDTESTFKMAPPTDPCSIRGGHRVLAEPFILVASGR